MIKNKKGFTLIELIIVMAIVGILAVVAVVAISSKAGDARDARRQHDLSSIQLAYALYTSDGYGSTGVHTTTDAPVIVSAAVTNPGTYMNMTNVEDPNQDDHSGACASSTVGQDGVCTAAGDYTLLEVSLDDIGTFQNFKIGATLENGSPTYMTQLGFSN